MHRVEPDKSKFRRPKWLRFAIGYAIAALLMAQSAAAATFTVDTTSDNVSFSACTPAAADCSLRGAITASNNLAGADAIEFNIPTSEAGCDVGSGICRLEVNADYPAINQPLSINGYTQPGAQPNTIPAPGANNAQLKIEITQQGAFVSNRLFPMNGSATLIEIRGLAVFLPSNGIISGGLRHVIRGNWFGVTASGQVPTYTGPGSVFDLGSFNRSIIIGGPDPADRNVIAGSGRDLSAPALPGGGQNTIRVNSISSDRGQILFQGNLFGLGPDGITPLPFRDPLIVSTGDDGFDTPDIRILDNRMARAARNFSCLCGGVMRFAVSRAMVDTALIQGNIFGLGVDGSVIGVERDHIEVFLGNNSRVPRVLIGGLGAGLGNVFAGALARAGGTGVGPALGSAVVLPFGSVSTFVDFVGNQMLGNEGIGIDFPHGTAGGGVALGRTLNDAGDIDVGANSLQNHPEISAFAVNGASFNVSYRVDSDPANSLYPLRVDFYKALGDEGEILLDSDVYPSTSAQQAKSAMLTIPPGVVLGNDDVIVAIASDAEGRSSEFSFDPVSISVVDAPDPQPAGLPFNVAITAVATAGPFKPNGVVDVSMNTSPATICRVTLTPTVTANTSSGSCQMIPVQTGNRTLTATYRTLQGAFASSTGTDVVVTEPHVVSVAGPEQIGFARCRQNVVEGETAQIRIERPSGGVTNVSLDFTHTPGTATPGDDYTVPANQQLQWAPGDIAAKLIDVPTADDGLPEPTERFRANLANVMGAALLPFAQIDVDIVDAQSDQRFANGFEGPECLP
jgi:hypothetical protein